MVNQSLPFAMALLELGAENDEETLYKNELSELNGIYTENPELSALFNAPNVSKEEKLQMLNSLFEGSLSQTMMHFLQILVEHRMAGRLPEINQDYIRLYNQAHDIEQVKVTSAVDLDERQVQALKEMLEKKLNKHVTLKIDVDPALIAGLRIETESRTLDNSYAARLAKLKDTLLKG